MKGKTPAVSARSAARQPEIHQNAGADANAACAPCHAAIYERYRHTPMANASGLAADGFLPGTFAHEASGVSYRVVERTGRVVLEFERDGMGSDSSRALKGERELKYFLGSGKRGRTYLYEQEGYWFEIPVNWYAKKRIWDMAPNYQNVKEMPLTLPVDPGCLRCHTSDAQPSLPEARNKYSAEPFLHGGITCTACHGDAAAHLASGGRTSMLKIDSLPAEQRDSVCLNCHIEGQEAIVHQARRLVDFRPGDSIFDYASFFVRSGQTGSRATSQWEALLQSGCKRGAGERLTCTSCHDPHGSTDSMSAVERVQSYRARCLACHDSESSEAAKTAIQPIAGSKGFAARHHPENPDCISCHMPRAKADDIAHEQVTDHRIPRIAGQTVTGTASTDSPAGRLSAIGARVGIPGVATERDIGMAYALDAIKGDYASGTQAQQLLRRAELLPGSVTDHELHQKIGLLDQIAGDKDGAALEYEEALSADPHDAVAAGNLALLKADGRQYGVALELLEQAFRDDPVQLRAGMNLAIVACGVGKKEDALAALERILAFSPDDGQARDLEREIKSGKHPCAAR